MSKTYKVVFAIFILFFVVEYTIPIINSLKLGDSLGWTVQETLSNPKVLKHVIRLPLYFAIYLYIFLSIPKKSKIAYFIWEVMAWTHLIFKPLTTITLLVFVNKAGMLQGFPFVTILFTIITFMVYFFSIFFVKKYWLDLKDTKNKTS